MTDRGTGSDPARWRQSVDPPAGFGDDWVVLGGGTCGLFVALQLLRQTDRNVWVIESMPTVSSAGLHGCLDQGNRPAACQRWRQRPVDWLRLLGTEEDYAHQTAAEDHLADRRIGWPRGRGLGGSGRINAMIWMPPADVDYESLLAAGLDRSGLERAYRLALSVVQPESPRWMSESSRRFLRAAEIVAATQGHSQWATPYQRMNRRGRRWTAADAIDETFRTGTLLGEGSRDAANRLRVIRADVSRVELEQSRAKAVHLRTEAGVVRSELSQDSGLISCLGALGTPALCLHSGIGPAGALEAEGLVVEVPGLGDNLHDHLIMPVIWRVSGQPFAGDDWTTRQLCQWVHDGSGPIASNIAECGGVSPDGRFQVHVTPTDYLRFPNATASAAMSIGVSLTQPGSRGTLRISPPREEVVPANGRTGMPQQSNNPFELSISPAYLSAAEDREALVRAVRWAREIASAPPLSQWCGREIVPGVRRQTDRELSASIARYAQTLYHPGGTCQLGRVVDSSFRIRGIDNFHVADASLLPRPTVANPTAVLAMLTTYAADAIARPKAK